MRRLGASDAGPDPRPRRPDIVFVDRLTVASVLATVRLGPRRLWWCFERPGGAALAVARLAARARLLPGDPRLVDRQYADIRDELGQSDLLPLLRRVRELCIEIRDADVARDPLVRAVAPLWRPDVVVRHFERLIEDHLRIELRRIELVREMIRAEDASGAVLLVARSPWHAHLWSYAMRRRVRVAAYPDVRPARNLDVLGRLGRGALALAVALVPRGRTVAGVAGPEPARAAPRGGTVAIQYGHRVLTGDPTVRSELFWLRDGLPIVLYGYPEGRDAGGNERSGRPGLRLVGAPSISEAWAHGGAAATARVVARVLAAAAASLLQLRPPSGYVLRKLLSLAIDYGRWYGLYRAHAVNVQVAPMTGGSPAQVLALGAVGAVSTTYQTSASNIVAPSALLSAGEDIHFVFSARFEDIFRDVAGRAGAYVPTGFIYDSAFAALAGHPRVWDARARLEAHGARYVLTFFDEYSSARWDAVATDRAAAEDYRYLLGWLLEDTALGLVLKPKKAHDLGRRLGDVAALLETAERTGRCVTLGSEALIGDTYPAEAALIGDVTVAKLIGSTAGLEAWLAGRPSILIDTEGLTDHPLYGLGVGDVVFTSWPDVRTAVVGFAAAPHSRPRFGDWSRLADELDPYQDGQAALRMYEVIRDLARALGGGATPEEAIDRACSAFRERWGHPRGRALMKALP